MENMPNGQSTDDELREQLQVLERLNELGGYVNSEVGMDERGIVIKASSRYD